MTSQLNSTVGTENSSSPKQLQQTTLFGGLSSSVNPFKKTDRQDRSAPPASGQEVVTNIPDYYGLLELDKSATHEEMGDAYRYFMKHCHPVMHKHKDAATRERNARLFVLYNEAYEVLGNAKSRAVYDFYGGKAARNGILHDTFDYRQGAYNKENSENPEGCFRKYTYSKCTVPKILQQTHLLKNLLESRDNDLNYATVQPVIQDVHLTLEELYNGAGKIIKTSRRTLDSLSAGVVHAESSLELKILPGWTAGTRVIYPKMGPVDLCVEPADLILQIVVDLHPRFRLDGYDIYTTVQISLAEVMGTGPVNIQHLDGRNIPISLTDLASPNTAKIVKDEGLPKDELRTKFGDLFVDFDIVFPDEVDPWQKLELWVALVEYPRPRPPLHYAIAPISALSLQRSDAKPIPFDIPKEPVAPPPDAEAVGGRADSPDSETLDPDDVDYRNKLGEQYEDDQKYATMSPDGMEKLEEGQVAVEVIEEEDDDGEESYREQYVEDVEAEDGVEETQENENN